MTRRSDQPDPAGCRERTLEEAQEALASRLYGQRAEVWVHGFPAWDGNLRDFDEVSPAVVVVPASSTEWIEAVGYTMPRGSVGWGLWWGSDATDVTAFQNISWRVVVNKGVYAGPFPALAQLNSMMQMTQLHVPIPDGQRIAVEVFNNSIVEYSVIARIKGVFHREIGEMV